MSFEWCGKRTTTSLCLFFYRYNLHASHKKGVQESAQQKFHDCQLFVFLSSNRTLSFDWSNLFQKRKRLTFVLVALDLPLINRDQMDNLSSSSSLHNIGKFNTSVLDIIAEKYSAYKWIEPEAHAFFFLHYAWQYLYTKLSSYSWYIDQIC